MLTTHGSRFKSPARRRAWLAAAAVAALLGPASAALAGETLVTRVSVFGDSISDDGAYAAPAPPGAGTFTTNPDPNWVETIATGLGLPLSSSAAGVADYAEGGDAQAQCTG